MLTAQRFVRVGSNRYAIWSFKCDCGKEKEISTKRISGSDGTKSCGCLAIATQHKATHGHAKERTPEYQSWSAMKERCFRENHSHFDDYGGRGISVCERWMHFENFLADMGARPGDGYSLERIDNDGNYEPGNCRWATSLEQVRNRRCTVRLTSAGETLTLKEWSRRLKVSYQTLYGRYKRGLDTAHVLKV